MEDCLPMSGEMALYCEITQQLDSVPATGKSEIGLIGEK